MDKWSVKIKLVHNEIFICEKSKMLKSMNIHFNMSLVVRNLSSVLLACSDKLHSYRRLIEAWNFYLEISDGSIK